MTKTVLETALEAEISEYLGCQRHDPAGRDGGNSRNGTRPKMVLTVIGPVEIEVPRDRDASFSCRSCASANADWTASTRSRCRVICSTNAIESLYLVTRFLDPTGKGRARWSMRWKPALNAFAITFAITFEDRIVPTT